MNSLITFLRRKLSAATRGWRRHRLSPLEHYLSQATDHADLERRMRFANACERRFF